MPEQDVVSWNAMLSGYVQNGYVDEAREVFDSMLEKNSISWNGLLAAYKRLGDARRLFDQLPFRDDNLWNTMISGYAQDGDLSEARRLFEESPSRDVFTWTSMVSGYVHNGMLDEAIRVFDEMCENNEAAIIVGYAQNSHYEEALNMFVEMKRNAESLNMATFSCALSTCADIAALELRKQVQGQAVKTGYETGCFVGNALLGMYFKCGSIGEAYDVFVGIEVKDIVSWNTMLAGYARHGFCKQDLTIFESMKMADGAASGDLLGACRIHGNTELGEKAAEMVLKMEPHNTGIYVLLSNLYAASGRWVDVGKMR
ncbi:hypothetical protein TanjilG_21876 [Lupinus angustifolius]|nr:hypothetical protein TanjilG_21876 [Lupinus angustifolius]